MSEIEEYFSGDTVRFSAEFRDYPDVPEEEGDLINPSTVTVTVYDADMSSIATGTGDSVSTGIFSFDYTVPSEPGTYFIEWKGMVNSKPEVKREKFKVKFWVNE